MINLDPSKNLNHMTFDQILDWQRSNGVEDEWFVALEGKPYSRTMNLMEIRTIKQDKRYWNIQILHVSSKGDISAEWVSFELPQERDFCLSLTEVQTQNQLWKSAIKSNLSRKRKKMSQARKTSSFTILTSWIDPVSKSLLNDSSWIYGGVFLFFLFLMLIGGLSSPSSNNGESILESALRKAEQGRATDMTIEEMNAFREKNLKDSLEHKNSIRTQLTREEKAMQDYEDEMILKGETRSNPYYEELQRNAQESRR